MLTEKQRKSIQQIWKKYHESNFTLIDLKGVKHSNTEFDSKRVEQIKILLPIIKEFLDGNTDLKVFKSSIDSENKKNNYWGFTAIKGQMFFNQLVKCYPKKTKEITKLLQNCIIEPTSLKQAKRKIMQFETYIKPLYFDAKDKRKVPSISSINYFLSYFWQLYNYEEWPIHYTSLVVSLKKIDIWKDFDNQASHYEFFYKKINEIREYVSSKINKEVNHWDIEHAFWFYDQSQNETESIESVVKDVRKQDVFDNTFKYPEFIPPIVDDLIDVGASNVNTTSAIGKKFEDKVSAVFKMLDFDVQVLGQGTGREPDAIAKFRTDNTVFLIDAKSRKDGYSIGVDDRAIKEYINKKLPKLKNDGYKKTGFIIVSTKFLGEPDNIIDQLTLETDIKRVTLLTSEALLYLLAYRLKDNLSTSQICDLLLQNGIIDGKKVVESLEDY